jgi:hypothetical protein
MKTIAKLESKIAALRQERKNCADPERAAELDEKIDSIQDDIDELEEAEADEISWQEMTGTTAQDRYIDQNSHAIAQSERYEQFRNEY